MRSKLTKIVRAGSACPLFAAAILALAITFTLSCSSDTPSGGPGPVTPPVTPPNNGSGTMTWTMANSPFSYDDMFQAIAYGNGTWVAVSSLSATAGDGGGKIAYSTDNGKTWTAVENNPFTENDAIYDIAYGNNKFVAVGGGSTGKIAYSSDGITWTAKEDILSGGLGISAIAFGNGMWVAGESISTAYSSDGITWTESYDIRVSNITAIAYGNGKFVAVGSSGKMAYSSNGITWTTVDVSNIFGKGLDDHIDMIAYGNGKFVAFGDHRISVNRSLKAYSSDGVTWTQSWTGGFPDVEAIAFGNGTFVAGGYFGEIAYSTGN